MELLYICNCVHFTQSSDVEKVNVFELQHYELRNMQQVLILF